MDMLPTKSLKNPGRLAIISILLGFLQVPMPSFASTCTVDSFAGGSGTSVSPFAVSTETQLTNLRFCLGPSHAGKFFSLSNSISLTSAVNLPIAPGPSVSTYTNASSFMAKILGNNHLISLPSNGFDGTGKEYVGLFGFLDGASISSLSISGIITGTGKYAGLLAGAVTGSSFVDVSAVSAVQGLTRAGGLVGWVLSNSTFSRISVVVNTDASSQNQVVSSGESAGGIAGFALTTTIIDAISNIAVSSSGSYVGGLVGVAENSTIRSSRAFGNVSLSGSQPQAFVGGLVGRLASSSVSNSLAYGTVTGGSSAGFARVGGLVGLLEVSSIFSSHAYGLVGGRAGQAIDGGGLVGQSTFAVSTPGFSTIGQSSAKGDVSRSGSTVADSLGGLVGRTETRLVIEDSYSSGRVSGGTFAGANVGGLIGRQVAVATISRAIATGAAFKGSNPWFPFIGTVSTTPFTVNNFFSSSSLVTDDSAGGTTLANPLLAASMSDIATFQQSGFDIRLFSQTQVARSVWLMCGSAPILSSEPALDHCPMYPVSGVLDTSGQVMTLTFNGEISELPNISAFTTTPAATVTAVETTSARVLRVSFGSALPGGIDLAFSYTKPSAQGAQLLKRTGTDSVADNFTFRGILNNSTLSGPIVLGLTPLALSPTSIALTFECGGSCNGEYSYVASLTPPGGPAVTQASTALGVASLSFNNLVPDIAYVVSVTVSHGGLTSPAAATSVTTPRPLATISAVVVADTSATLTVGCTNCGAAPDSFVITATPQAGGSAITSSTAVVSGLTSETTYSFAVVVRFIGVDSASVNWRANPLRTLPFIPIVSVVTPASLPEAGGFVTVTGANFSTSTLLSLNGASLSFTIVDGTTITFTAPAKTAGAYALSITNPVGTYSLPNAVTYVVAPSLITNSPSVGTANGGTIVILTGTGLGTAHRVDLGPVTVSFSVVSQTAIRFVTPAYNSASFDMSASPMLDIKVTTLGGDVTLTNGFGFTSSPLAPVVSIVSPSSGPAGGGTAVTVFGRHFSGSYSNLVSAAVNGFSGSSVVLIDDSTLIFTTPSGAAAEGLAVSIATGGGLGTLALAFTYITPPAGLGSGSSGGGPTVSVFSLSKRVLSVAGGEFVVYGERLGGVVSATLGGAAASISKNSGFDFVLTVGPLFPGTWNLVLTGEFGTITFVEAITVPAEEVIAEVKGTLIGFALLQRFSSNSRELNPLQKQRGLAQIRLAQQARSIVCWGYTTSVSPNAWALAHATQRAEAACKVVRRLNSNAKLSVRIKNAQSKEFAMRAAFQFWK